MSIEAVELELPDVEELETPFKRRVAMLVVGITFFGAIVATGWPKHATSMQGRA